jgi:hypothetical protein
VGALELAPVRKCYSLKVGNVRVKVSIVVTGMGDGEGKERG